MKRKKKMNKEGKQNNSFKNNTHTNNKIYQKLDYFIVDHIIEACSIESAKSTQKIQNTYSNVFKGIGCFKGTLSLQVKDDKNQTYQVPLDIYHMQYKNIQKRAGRT